MNIEFKVNEFVTTDHEADLLAGARITCEQLAAQLALEETQMLLAEKTVN